ncbi:MAG: tetratricopeptide repeat protein [Candidatus Aminicenantes bacterium]
MKFSKKIAIYAIAVFLLLLFFPGCAMQSLHKKRAQALYRTGDYDQAVKYLEKAIKEKPSPELNLLLFRAKLNSYFYHLGRARVFKDVNKKEEAIKEYQIALRIFPNNKKLMDEVELYLNPEKKEKKPFVPTVKPPVILDIDASEKMSLSLTNTPITKIFKVVGKSYGVNFIFDKDFRDFVYSIEVEKIGFYEALKQLCMVGNAEYRILDKSSVLIFPNTTFKKRTFGLRGVKVFYLANSTAEDVKKLLMAVFRDQQILVQEDKNLNSLIIKAEYSTLVEIEKFIASIDKSKGEVAIDVEILEVTKNFINAMGTSFGDVSSPVASIDAGFSTTDDQGVSSISKTFKFYNIPDVSFFMTIPSAALSFLESDDNSRLIARPNLRGVDGEEIKFLVGDEVPVPQTQFQAGAAGGFSNIPVTTYQYRNVGVDVKLTPFIHNDNEITIKIKLTINSIAGSQGDFPIFGKRELENIIRLKEGETNIIGGFIKDELRQGIQGIPALSRLPILGKLFGASGKEVKETDLIFSITPRIIRQVDITAADKETIWADVEAAPQGSIRAPEAGRRPPGPSRPGADSVIISPAKRRLPVNSTSIFTLRVNTRAKLASLSISGSVSGGEANIEEAKTDNFFGGQKVQVLANTSGTSFDLGYTFPDSLRSIGVVAQLRIKFSEKGNYTINLGSISAMSTDRQSVDLTGTTAEIEVY